MDILIFGNQPYIVPSKLVGVLKRTGFGRQRLLGQPLNYLLKA